MEQYFTKQESIDLLGSSVVFKQTQYMEVEGYKYPRIQQGTPGEVFSIFNLPEGIKLGVFVDEDIEEFRKDEFDYFCELNHASSS